MRRSCRFKLLGSAMEDLWNFQQLVTFLTLGREEHNLVKSEPGGSSFGCHSLEMKRMDSRGDGSPLNQQCMYLIIM
jgi:hypothetical protein